MYLSLIVTVHFKYDLYSQSPPNVKWTSERGESEVGRGGSRSDRGRGREKSSGHGGKREPKAVEPKKYEEPEVKVRQHHTIFTHFSTLSRFKFDLSQV